MHQPRLFSTNKKTTFRIKTINVNSILDEALKTLELTYHMNNYFIQDLMLGVQKFLYQYQLKKMFIKYTALFQSPITFIMYILSPFNIQPNYWIKNITKSLAIIGTRACHIISYKKAHQSIKQTIARTHARLLISGGAKGCDSIAENFAYKYNFPFIKIVPTILSFSSDNSFNIIQGTTSYRQKYNTLIASPNLIIPSYKFKYSLRQRNFYISLLASSILALQTPLYSGTLIALQHALHQNKPILFPEYPKSLLQQPMYKGQLNLMKANIGRLIK